MVAILKLWWVSQATAPFIFNDEYVYKAASQAIFQGQGYFIDRQLVTVYPPLYSIVIAPAFLAGPAFYQWILRINVGLSTLTLIPIWLFAKRWLPRRERWLCILIAAADPFQWVSVRTVLSVNLFLPLILWACYLLSLDSRRGIWRHIALGVVLGLAGLTQHIAPALWPFALLLWWRQPWLLGIVQQTAEFKRQRTQAILLVSVGLVLSYGPWLRYALANEASLPAAFGLSLLDNHRLVLDWTNLLTRIAVWLTLTLAAIILVNGVFLQGLAAQIALLRRRAYRRDRYSLALFVGGTVVFGAVGLLYSFPGNLAQNIVTEQYYIYLVPLLPVIAFRAFSQYRKFHPNQRASLAIDSAMVAGLLVFVAGQLVRHSPADYFQIHETTYSYALARPIASLWGIDLVFIVLALLVIHIVVIYRWPQQAALVMCLGVMALYGAMDFRIISVLPTLQSGGNHSQALADALLTAEAEQPTPTPIPVYLDAKLNWPPGTEAGFVKPIRFWNVPLDSFTIQIATRADVSAIANNGLWLTKEPLSDQPFKVYSVARTQFYIYRLPLASTP